VAMIEISIAIKDHFIDPGGQRLLSNLLPNILRVLDIYPVQAQFLRRNRSQGNTFRVVDQLRVDTGVAFENRKPGSLSSTTNLLSDTHLYSCAPFSVLACHSC